MAQYPLGIPLVDSITGSQTLAAVNHASRHNTDREEIAAIAAKVGVNSSAVETSHDYKLSLITGANKAQAQSVALDSLSAKTVPAGDLAGTTDVQTFTNKTHTSPKLTDAFLDTNGNELFKVTSVASAVNEVTIANAAAGSAPSVAATGNDTNIDLVAKGKGTGRVVPQLRLVKSNFTAQGSEFTTTSSTFVDITGMSMTYTSGPTAETLILRVDVSCRPDSVAAASVTLNDGADLSPEISCDGPAGLTLRRGTSYMVNVAANTTITLKLRAKIAGGIVFRISNNVVTLLPTIYGFAVAQ